MKIENIKKYEELMEADFAVIDFYAEWCGPCRMLLPIVEKMAEEHPEFNLYKLNIDDFADLAEKHNVQSVPTVIYFKKGQEVDRSSGFLAANVLKEKIEKNRK